MQHAPICLRHSVIFVYSLLLLLLVGVAHAEPQSGVPLTAAPQQPAVVTEPQPLLNNGNGGASSPGLNLLPVPDQPIQPLPTSDDVFLPMQWLADDTGSLGLREILTPDSQKLFTPYTEGTLPHKSGTFWLRLPLSGPFPTEPVLDLNTRIADQLPGTPQVWLAQSDGTGTLLRSTSNGLYPLPSSISEGTAVYLKINGLPAPGFAPSLISKASIGLADEVGEAILLAVLAVTLFICLLRGLTERREWRMWAALYIGAIWVQAFWGLPATTAGVVSRWDLPGLLSPGVALLILPHIGRHIMQTRDHSPVLDFLYTLLGLAGMLLVAVPLLPDYAWTLRYLPLWPLFSLLLLPLCLASCVRHLPGAKRFFLICLLPSLGVLIPHFLSIPETEWLTTGAITLLPSIGLTLSALLAALVRSPKPLPVPNRKRGNRRTESRGHTPTAPLTFNEPLSMGNEESSELTLRGMDEPDRTPRMEPPLPVNEALQHEKGRKAGHILPGALRTTLTSGQVEGLLRSPLDALLREIAALDQMNLGPEARRRLDTLSRAGKTLTALIGNMSRTAVQPEKAVAPQLTETFDLYQLLLEVHDAVQAQAEAKNLGLTWFTAPHLPRYYDGQRIQLAEVLEMLTESAVLATDRGMVQIRAQRVPESTDPGHLLFTISDTGAGIPPFSRSSLAFVRAWELAAAGGNSISLVSKPEGTTISFSMHLTARSAEIPLVRSETVDKELVSKLPASSLRILVVSGVSANRQLLSYYLNELPHEILEARTPEEAQQVYCNAPGALIIFDDDMPEEAIAKAIAAIRIFEGEYNFPLASILALVSNDEQRERLRRAGCTHTLMKPVVRKDLRHLTLRLAPVPRRYKDTEPAEDLPAETDLPSKETTVQVSPVQPPLPLPEEKAPEKKRPGFLARLLGRGKSSGKQSEQRSAGQGLTLLEKGKSSSVGDPMPISRVSRTDIPEQAHNTAPADSGTSASKQTTAASQEPDRPSRRHQPAPAVWTPFSENRLSSSGEWVGEPMPIPKKSAESQTASSHAQEEARTAASPERLEWVGEPTPIVQKKESPKEKAPLSLSPLNVSRAERENNRVQPAVSEAPIDLVEWVGEPMPIPRKKEAPLSMTPTAKTELKLEAQDITLDLPSANQGLTLDSVRREPEKRNSRTAGSTPLPDLFGAGSDNDDAQPLKLLDDVVELGVNAPEDHDLSSASVQKSVSSSQDDAENQEKMMSEAPSTHETSAGHDSIHDDTVKDELNPDDKHSRGEDSDATIQCLLQELDVALEQVVFGQKRNDMNEIRKAASRIAKLAETFDLRVLDDPARCIEMAAEGGDMEEIQQLVPDLAAAIAKNRAAFEEKAD